MRKLNVILIGIFSLIALLIIAVIVAGILFQNTGSIGIIGGADGPTTIFTTSYGERELHLDQTLPAAGIDNIELSLRAETVDIHEAQDGQFRIVHYGRNLTEQQRVTVEQEGGTLRIGRTDSGVKLFNFGGFSYGSWVELYIPADYRQSLDVAISSGDLKVHNGLSLTGLNVKLSSGTFRGAGEIAAADVSIRLTSGDLKLEHLDCDQFLISMSSGSASINALSGSGSAKLTSGDLRLLNTRIDDHLYVKLSSGTASIELADDPSLEFHGKLSSGTIRTYFDLHYTGTNQKESYATVGEGPYKKLTAELTSGDVRITSVGGSDKSTTPGDSARDDAWGEFSQAMDELSGMFD